MQVVIPPTDPGCFPELNRAALQYCERFLEFLIDLLSQVSGWVGGRLGVPLEQLGQGHGTAAGQVGS